MAHEQSERLAYAATAPTAGAPPGDRLGTSGPGAPGGARRPNRAASVAWKVFGGVMVVFTLWWGIYTAVTMIAHEEYTEVTTFASDEVESLVVGTASGKVTVTASEDASEDEIVVSAHISDGLRKTGNRQEIVDGELQLDGSCPVLGSSWCSIGYTVEVPADLDVRVDTGNGAVAVRGVRSSVDIDSSHGGVDVEDVVGDVRLRSSHGSISATGLAATDVVASSGHGSIDLELTEMPSRVDTETDHGSIDVAVPDTPDAYDVDIGTDHGSETTSVRTDPDSGRTIRIQSDHGDVTVRYAR